MGMLGGGELKIYFIGTEIYINNFNLLFFYMFYDIVTIIGGKVSILFSKTNWGK